MEGCGERESFIPQQNPENEKLSHEDIPGRQGDGKEMALVALPLMPPMFSENNRVFDQDLDELMVKPCSHGLCKDVQGYQGSMGK